MARLKATDVVWNKVNVLGKECLFSDLRIDENSVPEGYLMYEVRHTDEDWGKPAEIGLWIMVNFFGTLLVKEPFVLEPSTKINNSYSFIEDGDWCYLGEYVNL